MYIGNSISGKQTVYSKNGQKTLTESFEDQVVYFFFFYHDEVQFTDFFFSFRIHAFGVILKESLPNLRPLRLSPVVFSLEVLYV